MTFTISRRPASTAYLLTHPAKVFAIETMPGEAVPDLEEFWARAHQAVAEDAW